MSIADPSVLLQVEDLHVHFYTEEGTVRAVNGISFAVQKGQTLGVLGESGCGKSVTGFSLLRLVRPPGRIVQGHISYLGMGDPLDVVAEPEGSRRLQQLRGGEMSMIFQEPMTSLDPVYTAGDQVMEAISYHNDVTAAEARARAIAILGQVGLPEPERIVDTYPHQLSGGMRQRVMIAIALACHPQLLIADEPTTALDVTTEAQILELLRELQAELGMAMLFITHDLGVIAEMAQQVVVMYLGEIVERADVKELFSDPLHPYTQALLESVPRLGSRDRKRLQAIKGIVPSPADMPTGCTFHPRCRDFIPGKCDVQVPPLQNLADGRQVQCWLHANGETAA